MSLTSPAPPQHCTPPLLASPAQHPPLSNPTPHAMSRAPRCRVDCACIALRLHALAGPMCVSPPAGTHVSTPRCARAPTPTGRSVDRRPDSPSSSPAQASTARPAGSTASRSRHARRS
eukprot:4368214-Prymnesium_polylepis.2